MDEYLEVITFKVIRATEWVKVADDTVTALELLSKPLHFDPSKHAFRFKIPTTQCGKDLMVGEEYVVVKPFHEAVKKGETVAIDVIGPNQSGIIVLTSDTSWMEVYYDQVDGCLAEKE